MLHVPIVVDEVKTHGPQIVGKFIGAEVEKAAAPSGKIGGILLRQCQPKGHSLRIPQVQRAAGAGIAQMGKVLQNGAHVAGHIEGGNDFHTHLPGIVQDFLHVLLGEVPAGAVWSLVLLAVAVPQSRGQVVDAVGGSDHPVARGKPEALVVGHI